MENQYKHESSGCVLYAFVLLIILTFGIIGIVSGGSLSFWFCAGIIACAIIFLIKSIKRMDLEEQSDRNKAEEKMVDFISSILEKNNVTSTISYRYKGSSSLEVKYIMYIVDEPQKCVFVLQNEELTKIPFSEILDCKIYEDSDVSGGLGRAIVGGVLAGGVGAIVGATTAKKHISSYKISIIRGNISSPQTSLVLIDEKVETESNHFKSALEFAQNVYASVCAIIANNQK